MQFPTHGDSQVWRDGPIVIARLSGAWNKEAAQVFERQFHQCASGLAGTRWAHLVYLGEWDLCSSELFPVIERLVTWCIENGLVRAAQVYPPSSLKKAVLDRMVMEKSGSFERRVFDEPYEAISWLEKEGFTLSAKAS